MSFSKGGKSDNSQQTLTENTSRNLNLQDLEGINVGESAGDVTIFSTDGGAFSAAADLARRAIDSAGDAFYNASGLAGDATSRALSFAEDAGINASGLAETATRNALNFGSDALDSVTRANYDSLDLLGGLVSQSIDSSRTLARDAADANSRTVGDALAGFSSLAQRSSESSDDKMTRVIGYALAAVVAAMVLPSLFKGGKATV